MCSSDLRSTFGTEWSEARGPWRADSGPIRSGETGWDPVPVGRAVCEMQDLRAQVLQSGEAAWLAVDRSGRIDLDDVKAALETPTGIVSTMLANNETGVVQNVAAVGELARARRAWMHTDAVQALGKIPVDFAALNVHAMSVSAHKIYGPKGIGALILDKRIELKPLLSGGGHEQGLRSGTENVPGIVGFGAACELAAEIGRAHV